MTTTTRRPAVPAGSGDKAKKLWHSVVQTFELSGAELRILEDACREVDLIERLEKELKSAELVVSGSMGQPVASPLVQEIRQHRATFARLIAALKLPEEPAGEGGGSRSSSARSAAEARWGKRGAA